mmetsp:Transcript_10136/g.41001  ORF Transcript_10136/g.41001 Transcript_10136/m.41001 type:complete len:307 (+) Transcript_10136:258-1178(+)
MTASERTVARHTVTFEGVDAPSQCAPAPRLGDSTGARPSPSSSPTEKQTVARDHHVEGAFRGARIAPRLLGGWNGARREERPRAESPRPRSRAEPPSPVTAARRRVVAAEVKLGVERMKLSDKSGDEALVGERTDVMDGTERARTALRSPTVSNVTFARATRPGTSAAASRGCFATTSRRPLSIRGGLSSSSNSSEPGLRSMRSTRVGPHIARPHAGACTSLAAARQPSRTGLLPAQGRCDDSAAAALREMVARCDRTRRASRAGRDDVYAWNLSPPSPPRARPAAGDHEEEDSSPEWNPGRVTPW